MSGPERDPVNDAVDAAFRGVDAVDRWSGGRMLLIVGVVVIVVGLLTRAKRIIACGALLTMIGFAAWPRGRR